MPARDGDVSLTVGGQVLSGWQEVRVSRGIERMPSDFDIAMTEAFPGTPRVLVQPGQPCVLKIGDDTVITGFVDRYAPSVSKRGGSTLRISGRGLCQDLVDCSAYLHGTENQLRNATTKAVVERLCGLFGIAVVAAESGAVVPQFNVILTETCWDIIDRVARHSEFLAYEDTAGRLVLAKLGTERHASGFLQGGNVEQASAVRAYDKRYSLYEVIFMPVENLYDVARASAAGAAGLRFNDRADAKDDTIGADKPGTGRRFRPLILMAETIQSGQDVAQKRANWEKARRIGRSQAVDVLCDSWRDSAGMLWEPNRLAAVHLPSLQLPDRDWIVAEVTYLRGRDGTHAAVTLMPREAFLPEPILLAPFDDQTDRALNPRTAPTAGSGTGAG